MKLVAVLRTQEFCGDHSADVEIVFEIKEGETAQALYERLNKKHKAIAAADDLSIKAVVEP